MEDGENVAQSIFHSQIHLGALGVLAALALIRSTTLSSRLSSRHRVFAVDFGPQKLDGLTVPFAIFHLPFAIRMSPDILKEGHPCPLTPSPVITPPLTC